MTLWRRRKTLVLNLGLTALIVAGAGIAYLAFTGEDAQGAGGTRTVRVARGSVQATVSASGTVESARTVGLNFGTGGTVSAIKVKVGQKVKSGQTLATLDDTAAGEQVEAKQRSLDAAEADLEQAEDQTYRTDEEREAAVARAEAQVLQARADLRQAQEELAGTVLKAPMSGTVVSIYGQVGDTVNGGGSSAQGGTGDSAQSGTSGNSASGSSLPSGFIVLADLSKLQVKAYFAESDASKLKVGQQATVTLNAQPDQPIQATVATIDEAPTTSDNVVQYGVTLTLAKQPSGVRQGQSASVEVVTAEAKDALYLPSAAVQTASGESTVIVVENGQQVTKPVEIGVKGDQTVQIVSGLSEGDTVVLQTTGSGTQGGSQRGGFGGGFGGGGFGGAPGRVPAGGGAGGPR